MLCRCVWREWFTVALGSPRSSVYNFVCHVMYVIVNSDFSLSRHCTCVDCRPMGSCAVCDFLPAHEYVIVIPRTATRKTENV